MSDRAWHVGDEMLRGYARGKAGIEASASIEAHLVRCAACRARVPTDSVGGLLEAAWTGVLDTIHAPERPLLVRALQRLGMSEADGALLSAARALNGAWTLAILAVVVCAALAAAFDDAGASALYLIVAPLVPVAGVVVVFAAVDPLDELTGATPYSKTRLALLRTFAVVVTGVPLAIGIGLAVPGIAWLAFAWLLPALALTLATLVAMTWWEPEPAGVATACAWIAVVAVAYAGDRDVTGAFGPALQVAYLAVAALAAVVLAYRIRAARTPGGYA